MHLSDPLFIINQIIDENNKLKLSLLGRVCRIFVIMNKKLSM